MVYGTVNPGLEEQDSPGEALLGQVLDPPKPCMLGILLIGWLVRNSHSGPYSDQGRIAVCPLMRG